MSLIRKILLIFGGIVLLEVLLVFLPRMVEAACEPQWACSPDCIVTSCIWHDPTVYEPSEYCMNNTTASYGPVNCSAPLTDWPCGRVWVPNVEADCETKYSNGVSCNNGSASGGWRGCAGSPDATPTPTSPPAFVKALKRWEVTGTEARVEVQTVLRASRPEVLEELRKSKAGRFLGEILGPTAVIVKKGAQAKVLAALAELGLLANDQTSEVSMTSEV